jgi:hypothetical protein
VATRRIAANAEAIDRIVTSGTFNIALLALSYGPAQAHLRMNRSHRTTVRAESR